MPSAAAPFAPAIRRFLETPGRFAVIATLAEDGMPHQAVVWYRLTDEGILVNGLEGRRWPANLQRDPRVSLVVPDEYRHVDVRGRAELVAEGEPAREQIRQLAQRYRHDPGLYEDQARLSFLIRPERIWTWGLLD